MPMYQNQNKFISPFVILNIFKKKKNEATNHKFYLNMVRSPNKTSHVADLEHLQRNTGTRNLSHWPL